MYVQRRVAVAAAVLERGRAACAIAEQHERLRQNCPREQAVIHLLGHGLRNGKPAGKMEGYSCQIVINEAITWLDNKGDSEAPFFLNIWFNEPHSPIAAPDEIVERYGKLDDPAAVYSATIENTDRAIARLLEKLKSDDDLDNTIIVYSSDNGSYRDERNGPLRGSKGSLYEGGHRVPGTISWPNKIPGGRVEHEPAGVVDLLPTICGLAGIDKPQGVRLDGADISPILTGKGEVFSRRQPLFWIRADENPAMTLRVYAHALREEEGDLSFADFGSSERPYTAPRSDENHELTLKSLKMLAPPRGFEPLTPGLGNRCSIP